MALAAEHALALAQPQAAPAYTVTARALSGSQPC